MATRFLVLVVLAAAVAFQAVAEEPSFRDTLRRLDGFPEPTRKVGFVQPLPITDTIPYMFYGAFPHGVILVEQSIQLASYDRESARAALGRLDETLASIAKRGVEMIVVGGSVLSLAYDRPTLLARLKTASDSLRLPITTDMEATVGAMQKAGVRKAAVAHRLAGIDTEGLRAYLKDAGIELLGVVGPGLPPGAAAKDDTAYFTALGLAAARNHPEADAILVLGGSSVFHPAVAAIERGSGKPVFNNGIGFLYAVDAWLKGSAPKRNP